MAQQRQMINGGLLSHTLGQKVSIIGLAKNINSTGTAFDLKTVDNMIVKINLSSPLDDMLEGFFIEVHGTCQSSNIINAVEYISFSPEQSEDFDTEGHNNLCKLLQQISDVHKTG